MGALWRSRQWARWPVACLVGSAIAGLSTGAQPRRPMSLVDIAELSRALDPQLAPDGRSVLYELSHADWKANRPVWQIWRQEIGGGPPTELTFGDGGVTPGFTRWSPDGKTILFARGGQIVLMAADGGEPRALTHHATTVLAPSWSPDGAAVYFLASEARTNDERERDRLKDDVYGYEESFKQRQLWKVVVATGTERQISGPDASVLSYRVSRDGTRIALQRAPNPLAEDAYQSEIWTMDANGENGRAVTRNSIEEVEPELSPDNRQILFLADASATLEPYYNTNLFVVPAEGGRPRSLVPDFPYAFDRATWAPDGRSILAVASMGVHSEVFEINARSGAFKQLTNGKHAIPSAPAPAWHVEPRAGRVVFLLDEPTRFGELWTLPLAGGPATRVTGLYDKLDTTFALPRQERYEWTGADGARVEGLLFYPPDYQANRRYPLVVQMHGGPMESDKFGGGPGLLLNYFPVLTGKGYVVLRPNYRGSAGYGNTFYRDVVGHYFANMQLDVLTAIDTLVAKGIVDPDRLVVMGWSAGGHLTNKLITITDRFKAASSGAGAANFVSFYGQSDIRHIRAPWFGGTPWQADAPIDRFWNQSPVKDAANVKTPTLFFVGENDARVPMPQSVEMFQALKSNGVPAHLYIGPREPHQWQELRHQIAKANLELAWFEKYVFGRVYTPEKAPAPPGP